MKTIIWMLTCGVFLPAAGYLTPLFAVICAGLLGLLGLAFVVHELSIAPKGYEDIQGFHFQGRQDQKGYPPRVTMLSPRNAT